jgi:hypothetical protein
LGHLIFGAIGGLGGILLLEISTFAEEEKDILLVVVSSLLSVELFLSVVRVLFKALEPFRN